MRIAVTGQAGQVVSALREVGPRAGHEIIPLGRPLLDLALPESVLPALKDAAPDVVVSAAAYTAVDKAEAEPKLAKAVNGLAPGAVGRAAALLGVPVIHLSTDYVFDGSKSSPYAEDDLTNPLGAYGETKLLGERTLAGATNNHVILRVSWVYSPFSANFVKTMLRLAETRDAVNVVADQLGGPTSALEIAGAIVTVAERLAFDSDPALRGIFHLPPKGEASWADLSLAVFEGRSRRGGNPVAVNRIATSDYPTPARRPANSRLAGGKIASVYGIELPSWRDSLEICLERLLAPAAAEPEAGNREGAR